MEHKSYVFVIILPNMFQWTNSTQDNNGEMWLRYLNCRDEFNVMELDENMSDDEKQIKRNPLALFRKLTDLRKLRAIHDGNIFYPMQDREIFTFLR